MVRKVPDFKKPCWHEISRWLGALLVAFQASLQPILGHRVAFVASWGPVHRSREDFSLGNIAYAI